MCPFEHTPSTEAAPVLHCLVWCLHKHASLTVCVHYIKVRLSSTHSLPLSHCVIGPCAVVVRETLYCYRLTFRRWICTEYFNNKTALCYPCMCGSVCVCWTARGLRDVILLTSLHLQNSPSQTGLRREEEGGLQ